MTKRKAVNKKLGAIDLTERELEIVMAGVNSEFFDIVQKKILPQRRLQISLTAMETDQRMEDIWFHRGMIHACKWLPNWLNSKAVEIDDADYDNDDDSVTAEDDHV